MAARDLPPDEPSDEHDVDAQWRDIVARLGDLDQPGAEPQDRDPRRTRPQRRKTDLPGSHTVRPAHPPRPEADADEDRTGQDEPSGSGPPASDPRAWAPDPDVAEAEDHFVPPDPGPVLGGDPLLTMAWVVVLAAPTLAVVALIAWRDIPSWLLQVAGVAFLLAVGVLVWRMPHRRDDDDPGAVV
ncbi:hypothetical protein OEB99_19310 [Actinotalea sp. M2MS4P-6]|uniref:hypothetical protein n=1 Tax=Actinotalea sp. M2MS4P-6 TaxID=2983762 RepID=UPI0021E4C6E5|nr:hypothetical protein [Actinotalea sp. M2MS4P-6]MCV2396465.1 hypothetical protein [Actinotalea sp. M2MS4P-6]